MDTLFQNVLAMSLSASLLAAVVMGLRWFLKSSPKWVHCALWALVAVRLMVPSLPEWPHSMVPERVSDPEILVQMVEDMPALVPVPPSADLPQAPVILPEAPAPLPQPEPEATPEPLDWTAVAARIWGLGVLAMGVYAVGSYLKLRRRVAASVDIGNRVHLCDYIDTPFILGLIRPNIYLPSQLDSRTAGYVLAHERAHLQRRDHWWKPFGFVLLSFHWFNPMIWAAYILLCRDIEMACDEAVIRTMGEDQKKGYSSALLSCSIPRRLVSICPLAFGEVSVKERVRSVLNYRKPALWLTLLAVTALGAAAAFFLTDPIQEDVAFYQTAVYYTDGDRLNVTEYDKEFREVKQSDYFEGILQKTRETSYYMVDDTQLREVTYQVSRESKGTVCPKSGIEIYPGQTAKLTYREKLDDQGNVTDSTMTYGGREYTMTAVYDEQGNPLSKKEADGDSTSQVAMTYDDRGNLLSKKVVTQRSALSQIYEYEDKMDYDDKGNQIRFKSYSGGQLEYETKSFWREDGKKRSMLKTGASETDSLYTFHYDDTGLVETCDISWPDGTVYRTEVHTYDKYGNLLSRVVRDNGVEWGFYYNYIGSNGIKSNGIPKEIYTPGKAITAHPSPEQIPEDLVSLEAVDVTPTGCILRAKISPRGYPRATFYRGMSFTLEQKKGDAWEALTPKYRTDTFTPQELADLPLRSGWYITEWSQSWADIYGILPAGDYRLNTSLSDSHTSDCSVEFTVAENHHPASEERIAKCMKALNKLICSEQYVVEVEGPSGSVQVHAKSGMNYLYEIYSSQDTHYPVSGSLRCRSTYYEKIMGCWAINEGDVSPLLMEWFEEFVFNHEDLELLRGGNELEFPFAVKPRPGKELDQKDHKVTFFLDEKGNLTKIIEEGVITEYNGVEVEKPYSTTLTVVSVNTPANNPAAYPNVNICNSFFWENDKLDKVGGRYIQGQRYNNREPSDIEDVLDVYRLAQKELPQGLDVKNAMVARDKKAKMWRVEFRCTDRTGAYVYLDEDGITQMVKLEYPADLTPEKVDAALVKCRAVLDDLQRNRCYGLITYAYTDNRSGTGEATITTWVRGEDWVQSITAPTSDCAYVRMNVQGKEFENDSAFWGKAHESFSGGFRGDQGQFVPWLAGLNWDDYHVSLLMDQGIRIRLFMQPKDENGDSYEVSFRFDEEDNFKSVLVNMFHDGQVVTSEAVDLLSTDPDTVSQQILTYTMLNN